MATRVVAIASFHELDQFTSLKGLPVLSGNLWRRHRPDLHLIVIEDGEDREAIAAHCSLWWNETPPYPGHQVGAIGHYAAQNLSSAQLLLFHACQHLAPHATLAIAPMDGNTWRSYRLVSDRGSEPPFFLEPNTPIEWLEHFQSAGFTPLADYSSALNADLSQSDSRLVGVEQRLQSAGVTVRSLDLANFEQELEAIYNLCLISFQRNFLYTAIDRAEFLEQYSQIRPYVDSRFVLLAEHEGQLAGFLFAIPDLLQAQRDGAIDTIIIKTVAILPSRRYAGLGNCLVARVQAIAHEFGFTRAIHALMHEANNSRNLSRRYAEPMRRYVLMGNFRLREDGNG